MGQSCSHQFVHKVVHGVSHLRHFQPSRYMWGRVKVFLRPFWTADSRCVKVFFSDLLKVLMSSISLTRLGLESRENVECLSDGVPKIIWLVVAIAGRRMAIEVKRAAHPVLLEIGRGIDK